MVKASFSDLKVEQHLSEKSQAVPLQVRWMSRTMMLEYFGIFIVIFYLLFDVRILNVALYVSRRGMYACVRRWAICVCPRGV